MPDQDVALRSMGWDFGWNWQGRGGRQTCDLHAPTFFEHIPPLGSLHPREVVKGWGWENFRGSCPTEVVRGPGLTEVPREGFFDEQNLFFGT